MNKYSKLTQEEFERRLSEMIDRKAASYLLTIPGIYNILSEEYNSDILDELEKDRAAEKEEVKRRKEEVVCEK